MKNEEVNIMILEHTIEYNEILSRVKSINKIKRKKKLSVWLTKYKY